jgi:hypothetical protein
MVNNGDLPPYNVVIVDFLLPLSRRAYNVQGKVHDQW